MIPPGAVLCRSGTVRWWPRDGWVISEHTTDVAGLVMDVFDTAVRIEVRYDEDPS